jgi:6-phosphofructokinase 1
MITKMFKEEGGSLFDARLVSLGHTMQGNIPSPIDRTRAVRLSLKCMHFIEEQSDLIAKLAPKARITYGECAAVITVQGTAIKWVPVKEMIEQADMKNRRGKSAFWEDFKGLVEALVGRPQLV